MSYIPGADELVQNGGSYRSEKVAQDVGDYDDGCGELDAEILAEAYQQDHAHGKQGEQQLILYACHPAAQCHSSMKQCKRVDDPRGLYI